MLVTREALVSMQQALQVVCVNDARHSTSVAMWTQFQSRIDAAVDDGSSCAAGRIASVPLAASV